MVAQGVACWPTRRRNLVRTLSPHGKLFSLPPSPWSLMPSQLRLSQCPLVVTFIHDIKFARVMRTDAVNKLKDRQRLFQRLKLVGLISVVVVNW